LESEKIIKRQRDLKVHLKVPLEDKIVRRSQPRPFNDISLPVLEDICLGIFDVFHRIDVFVILIYSFLAQQKGEKGDL
jgi:hypothetical protein